MIVPPTRSRQAQQLEDLLDEARKRLVDTGTRNRLVHTNRMAKRPATVALHHPDVSGLFEKLRVSTGGLRFLANQPATERERRLNENEADNYDGVVEGELDLSSSSTDAFQTKLGEGALQKKLQKLAREAKTLEEEQGINILYLGIGFLRWFEDDKSDAMREAPLILFPVTLERDKRHSTYFLRPREDDLSTNLPLAERLRDQDEIILPEIPESDEWTVGDYFDAVEDAVKKKPRWRVDRSGLELGLFSFAKLLMFHDLSGKSWPGEAVLSHPLLRGIMQDGFESEPPPFLGDMRLDERFSPSDLVHVVDADGSQTLAIETVRAGRNLVIQGPPGTGKSQTIANIIAAAAHDGKKVLFIAEKMVALQVVHERLRKTGLAQLCLELHSRAANKRQLAEELARTLAVRAIAPDIAMETAQLGAVRDQLNNISSDLHAPLGETGMTAHRIIGDLVRAKGLGLAPTQIALSGATEWRASESKAIEDAAHRLAETVVAAGLANDHPLCGVDNSNLQPFDLDRLKGDCPNLAQDLEEFVTFANHAATVAGIDAIATLGDANRLVEFLGLFRNAPVEALDALRELNGASSVALDQALSIATAGAAYQVQKLKAGALFVPAALAANPSQVRSALAQGAASFFSRWFGGYRKASAELASWLTSALPEDPPARLALLDRLIGIQAARDNYNRIAEGAAPHLAASWRGEAADFNGLEAAAKWTVSLREAGFMQDLTSAFKLLERPGAGQALFDGISSLSAKMTKRWSDIDATLHLDTAAAFGYEARNDIPFPEIIARWRDWANCLDLYPEWANYKRACATLRERGQDALVAALSKGHFTPEAAREEVRHGRAEVLWTKTRTGAPAIAAAELVDRSRLVADFARLDQKRRASVAALIRARHVAAIPRGSIGDMAIIRGEIARKRGHKPIRKLLFQAGRTVQMLKPVFLMSPISVAQFLPPGSVEFDLLVIDEASQVRPEEALGVIARAKQIVVVGDVKQLPPTNFFARLMSDEETPGPDDEDGDEPSNNGLKEAARVGDLESILTLCEARGLPSRMLIWHYRSRHPSLIEVSNDEFYNANLILPPAPSVERLTEGLNLRRVLGVYDRGGKRTNVIEGRAIVEAAIAHAVATPDLSLGIVTFSTSQRDLLTQLLEDARRGSEVLDTFLASTLEEVFVKNLENVQGDERDVIFISVGYGPNQPGGRLATMSFGPVSQEGGERRLNVLFTRARQRCDVFASFDPGDIDLNRSKSRGARVLKRFLTYAESGVLNQPKPSGRDFDSAFEEDVARAINRLGHRVDAQVGSAGFRIDLAVAHPEKSGRYMLAVECDGATYHGALWARERDRLRQEILENLGWKFHRIWSTDWFHRRANEIEKLRGALELAAIIAPVVQPQPTKPAIEETITIAAADKTAPIAAGYKSAWFSVPSSKEPHEVPVEHMAAIVARIVQIEGPVHEEEISRRVATLFGKEKAGRRIVEATKAGLLYQRNKDTANMRVHSDFWFTSEQERDCPVRDRSAASASLQKAALISPMEILAANDAILEDNGEIAKSDLITATARVFGFQRVGPELRGVLEAAIDLAVENGRLEDRNGKIRMSADRN